MTDDLANAPRENGLAWWREHARDDDYVVGRSDFPEPAESAFLRAGGYVLEVAGGAVWILARPGVDVLPDAFYPNYWKVVREIMETYAPSVVERVSAVELHMDQWTPRQQVTIRHAANASSRTIELVPGYRLVLRPGEVDPELTVQRRHSGVTIPVEDPAETLLGLPLDFLRDNTEIVSLWLKSLVVSRPALEIAYSRRSRPVVLKRLGEIAASVGNERLAEQIADVIRGGYRHRVGRGHTGRGGPITAPVHIQRLATSHQPWLDRQAASFARFVESVTESVHGAETELPRFTRDAVLLQARDAKAYDAYHSTTIEGYRITPQEVSAVIGGLSVGGHDPEEVRSRMAVAGYSRAFETALEVVRDASGPVVVSEMLVQRLYIELFSPSVDAGIVAADALRGWRTEPAYLRGHVHVPAGPEKLPGLMRQYVDLVNGIESHPLVRAILAHLEFATVHPYPDGNGRLARLLMNVALLGEGLPWVTIRNDERPQYFAALHSAQVEGDPLPFSRFVLGYLRRAVEIMEPARP